MVNRPIVNDLKASAQQVLEENILPYWIKLRDLDRGGFYGQVTGDEILVPDAPRGAVLNARILWTFSSAYRILHKPEYLEAAQEAKRYIEAHFIDREYGGAFWSVTADGQPLDTHKQFYAQAFMLYAFSEYVRATDDKSALPTAEAFFRVLETYGRDRTFGGYVEAASSEWNPLTDMRLSDKDENTVKSQNTNLHVMEAYTNYYRVAPTAEVREALLSLIDTFQRHIMLPSGHLGLFFDEQWNLAPVTRNHSPVTPYSAGHDIECSWLLKEAADVLGIDCNDTVLQLAKAAQEGLYEDGSIGERTWWEEAEAVVGFVNLWQMQNHQSSISNLQSPMDIAIRTYSYILNVLMDREHGEWFWSVLPDGKPDRSQDKAGFWKCPYHNSRMCFELLERL
jgi:mannobiose 2-epimerase